MTYQQADAGRQRACVVGGVLVVQGVLAWAVLSGLAVRYVPEVTAVFRAHAPIEQPLPPMPPKPHIRPQPHHRAITATRPVVPQPRPTDTVTPDTHPFDPVPLGPPSGGTIDPPLPPATPKPSFTPLGARAIGDPSRWLTTDDYPASELRAGHEGAARFRLDVDADGRVTGCTIIASTGFAGLDSATCSIVTRRARFAPARGGDGAAVTGSYTGGVRWLIPRD
jgi:protein TonB